MPSTITHAYFAMDVYDRLPLKRKEFLFDHKNFLKISGQSMDAFFFYYVLDWKKGKKLREFGSYFHNHKVYLFFETLINYIKYNHFADDPEVMSFLYGMLCHYILDSTTHPYIVYRSGKFEKGKKETYRYNQVHGEMESMIDNYLVALREGGNPYKFRSDLFCFGSLHPFSNALKEVIDFTYKEVFHITDFSIYYEKSLAKMKFFYRFVRYDPTGLKYLGYRFIDLISPKSCLRKAPLSYHIKRKENRKLLNLDHEKWCNPTDKKMVSQESFRDLYLKSLFHAVKVIQQVDQYIYEDKKVNLRRVIRNYSYLTGRDCQTERELKFFAF